MVSASKDRADSFSIFTKRLIADLPALRHLKPDPNQGDRDSNVAFDVRGCKPHHAPSVKSVGITGQMTGSRADYIVLDDVEVVNNSETALQREKLLNRIAEAGGADVIVTVGEVRDHEILLDPVQVSGQAIEFSHEQHSISEFCIVGRFGKLRTI